MKKILIPLGIVGIAGAIFLGASAQPITKIDVADIQSNSQLQEVLDWQKPTTEAQWAEDTKEESLNLKFDYQLDEMLVSHQNKLAEKVQPVMDKILLFPDSIRAELYEQGLRDQELEDEFASQVNYWKWKTEKLKQSLERIQKEIELRTTKKIDRIDEIIGTTFYIDFACNTPGDGTTPTCDGDGDDSYGNINSFTNVARSAGDIVFVKRGTASTTNIIDIGIISDGNFDDPIVISADYDDIWGDFATSSQTYTITEGSKTMAASATITGIAANDWIYVDGDCEKTADLPTVINPCEYAYEVTTVSGTTLTLYLPYKGQQSGAGIDLRVMPDAPIWNSASGSSSIVMSSDNQWIWKGLDLRSSDAGGIIDGAAILNLLLFDTIFQSNGGGDNWLDVDNADLAVYIEKTRIFDADFNNNSIDVGFIELKDILFDFNNDTSNSYSTRGIHIGKNLEFINVGGGSVGTPASQANIKFRGLTYDTPHFFAPFSSQAESSRTPVYLEDANNVGANFYIDTFSEDSGEGNDAEGMIIASSTTQNLRSGGGTSNAVIRPTNHVHNITDWGKIRLFEYPIFTDTTSKQYDVYFSSTSTDSWTANPTANELWIECEYYNVSSGVDRYTKKSTGTLNFTGSTDFAALSVTCVPSQTGILYLRGWYVKPRESAKSNFFIIDTQPIIQ